MNQRSWVRRDYLSYHLNQTDLMYSGITTIQDCSSQNNAEVSHSPNSWLLSDELNQVGWTALFQGYFFHLDYKTRPFGLVLCFSCCKLIYGRKENKKNPQGCRSIRKWAEYVLHLTARYKPQLDLRAFCTHAMLLCCDKWKKKPKLK